jgi:uncharacterized protein (TIGR00156 family)
LRRIQNAAWRSRCPEVNTILVNLKWVSPAIPAGFIFYIGKAMIHTQSSRITWVFICTVLSVLSAAGSAQAQYVGPSATVSASTVAQILKSPVEDQKVLLRGKLTQKISHEKYLFSDGTASIRVEIDSDDFPLGIVSENTVVDIAGKVEKSLMASPEIDVKRVVVVTR